MEKKVTIIICDCCETELYEDDESYKCAICGKDACGDCITTIFDENVPFREMVVCENCSGDSSKFDKEMRKFFKQKHIKEKMDAIQEELKQYLVKITMVKNLS